MSDSGDLDRLLEAADSPEPGGSLEVFRLRSRLRDTSAELKWALRKLEEQGAALDLALAVSEHKQPTPAVRAAHSSTRRSAVAAAALSDWHVEEEVEAASVPGTGNVYSPEVARRRSERYFRGLVSLIRGHRSRFDIDLLLLGIIGDIITNYLRNEDREVNAMGPTQAILFALDLLSAGIRHLRDELPDLRVHCPCVHGNHGRITQYQQPATGHANSLETLLYHTLAREFASDHMVTFDVAEAYCVYTEVYGYTTRWAHGDQGFKFRGGVQGIGVPMGKWILRQNQARLAQQTVVGHYHTLGFQGCGEAVTNGSLIGPNPYSLSLGFSERPQQAFWLIDSERGACQMTPIWVD